MGKSSWILTRSREELETYLGELKERYTKHETYCKENHGLKNYALQEMRNESDWLCKKIEQVILRIAELTYRGTRPRKSWVFDNRKPGVFDD